ncbi:hypothetical protein FA13DRAFT_1731219 [Coprinellus micaceus]|jgi:hypothetical protein|uniref:Uncharacterized protein n=1 Tax=Coprinellus micaceus TaxID=71717 RepID=A0A4Y7TFD5_COPMI|nr:hypothetical protein FA13DRAFT_1731219 [Coprinellus micaceus]
MNAVQKTTPHNGEPDYPWSVKAPAIVLSGFFVGPIGSSILRMFSVELQEFDVLKSACVGALGALVYALVYFAMEPAIPPARFPFSIIQDPVGWYRGGSGGSEESK